MHLAEKIGTGDFGLLQHYLPMTASTRFSDWRLSGRGRAFLQRVERVLQYLADAGRTVRIDHVGVEIKIEAREVLAEDRDGLAGSVDDALDRIGDNLAADPFHGDRRQVV